jgi:molybdenum cofactor cytidylyltransferase
MIFGRVALRQARGGIMAHSLKTADRLLRKGALIDDEVFELLAAAAYEEVTIARLEPGDVPEGEAANQLGDRLLGAFLRRSPDVHGRVNLFATAAGLLRLDVENISRLNRIDESVTLATLADRTVVAPGDMVATLKIIPFAVAGSVMSEAEALIAAAAPLLEVKPFQKLRTGLILTKLPQLKDAAIAHTIAATRDRITAHGGDLLAPIETAHEAAPLRAAIETLLAQNAELILISGASAVTDRLDVAPQAVVAAGGEITHFGMPVDPGNLICFGVIESRPAIVLPGCARSPALNGIDWVLDRLFAGEPVGPSEVAAMGVGGLLKEIDTRPVPRNSREAAGFGKSPKARPRIAALVLAAGLSRRMGAANKLLAVMPDGRTMIAQTVDHVLASAAQPVFVVTGHQDGLIREALSNRPVRFIHAPDFHTGMAASLQAGVAALAGDIGAVMICLGDMPLVTRETFDRILSAHDAGEGRDIIIPTFDGQRGNPVLWGRRFFPELLNLSGDAGARQILHNHMEFVSECPVNTDSVLRDFDTPEMLATLSK